MKDSIKVINKDNLTLLSEINVGCQANDCRMTSDDRYIVAALDSGQLAFFDTMLANKELRIKIHESSIKSIYITSDQTKIYTFGIDCKLSHVKFPRLTLFRNVYDSDIIKNVPLSIKNTDELEQNNSFTEAPKEADPDLFKPLCMVQSALGDVLIAGGENNKIYLFNNENKHKIGEMVGHLDYVYSLAILNNRLVASGSGDNSIIIWDYHFMTSVTTLLGHMGSVTALARIDINKLASGSQDRSVKIWAWEYNLLLYTISDIPEPVVALTVPKSNMLLVGTKRLIQCWHLQSYTLIFEKISDQDIKCFRTIETGTDEVKRMFIGLGNDEKDLWIENPFTCSDINYWGPDEGKTYDLLTYLREMMMGKIPSYDARMDSWLISPYIINILHFYAYCNIPEYLGQSLSNGAPLLNSVCNSNPLTIAIEMNHKECIEIIIKSAWKQHPYNPYALSLISNDSLLSLNKADSHLLPKVYKILISNPYSLPKYCSSNTKLPASFLSFLPILIPKFIVGQENLTENNIEVRFLQTAIPLYLNPGSFKSIEFFKTLANSKQDQLFITEFMQIMVNYKWNIVRWSLYGEWLLFMGYFLCLLIGIVLDLQLYFFYIICGLGGSLTVFNLYYCGLSKTFSCWTAVDIFRSLMLAIYAVFDYSPIKNEEDYRRIILMILVFVSFIQGFYFFKLYSKSRNVIRIATDMIKESLGLIFMLAYIVIALVIAFYVEKRDRNGNMVVEFSNIGFLSIFDGLSQENHLNGLWDCLIEYAMPGLIFISLLAICTHIYDQNGDQAIIAEYKELSQIALKGEYLMPWRRNDNWFQYLQTCTHSEVVGVEKLKKVSRAIKVVKQEQEQHRYEISEGFGEIKEKIDAMHQMIKEMKNEKRPRKK